MSSDPPPSNISIQLFTISDTRSEVDDESGQWMKSRFGETGYDVNNHNILREDPSNLSQNFQDVIDDNSTDVLITTGGTGISTRDQTIEQIQPLLDKELPGFGELFRQLSYEEVGNYTVMSRALAGRARDTIVVALPGSPNAVKLAVNQIILDILPHMVKEVHKHR